VMGVLQAWELGAAEPAGPKPVLHGRPADGEGTVLILGAGLSGLAVGYELGKLGYDFRILEARTRVGGVSHTIRRGTEETDLDGRHQLCTFDDGEYFNAGPWRIPHTHQAVIDYCRELSVPLEIFVNENDSGYLYYEGDGLGPLSGQRVRLREVKADVRGHTAELLAKALDQGQLDLPLSAEDEDRFRSYLIGEGYLSSDDLSYGPGPARGSDADPYALEALLQAGFGSRVRSVDTSLTRPPVFQPVGGMDQLPRAFERTLSDRITFGAEVLRIRQTPDEVRVTWLDRSTGQERETTASYLVSCVPLSILGKIDADLSDEMVETVRGTSYNTAAKIGLQMARRFWEEDEGIYGGPTYTNLPLGQFGFPSNGFLSRKGVILGFYGNGGIAGLRDLSIEERIAHVVETASIIHPQVREEFESGYCAFWEQTRYSEGAYAGGGGATERLEQLRTPDGRIFIGCAAASTAPAWMEGAFSAAWSAVEAVHERAMNESPA
jgi:monoamine oxidase